MSCNISNLSAYTPTTANLWDKKKIQHFYSRLGFGATNEFITEALNQNPATFIENTINSAIALGSLDPPAWENMVYIDYTGANPDIEIQQQQNRELALSWANDMTANTWHI